MTLHAEKNLYPGINIHLNSILQNEPGGWANFHAEHIIYIREVIDDALPEGYFARSEKSLQIGEFDPGTGQEGQSSLKPDITIYRPKANQPGSGNAEPAATPPALTLSIGETLAEEDELTGLIIYQAREGSLLGRPITRIEVLSPANKPRGSHHGQYTVKRREALKSGLRLVEIDYLHQTPPIIHNLLDYSAQVDGADPYCILVSDPRPTFEEGTTAVYLFGVTDPLPVIDIPLAGADVAQVDFGIAYNHTFERVKFFNMVVDYDQEPVEFARYHEADRKLIQQYLTAIRKARR